MDDLLDLGSLYSLLERVEFMASIRKKLEKAFTLTSPRLRRNISRIIYYIPSTSVSLSQQSSPGTIHLESLAHYGCH